MEGLVYIHADLSRRLHVRHLQLPGQLLTLLLGHLHKDVDGGKMRKRKMRRRKRRKIKGGRERMGRRGVLFVTHEGPE